MPLGPMTSALTLHAAGNAPPDLAWERYAELARWAQWSPQIRSVTASGPRLVAGLTGTVHPLVGPGVRFTVDHVDEAARSWSWRVRLGPVRLELHHEVLAVTGGSGTTLRVHGPTPAVLAYAPLARWALTRLVRA